MRRRRGKERCFPSPEAIGIVACWQRTKVKNITYLEPVLHFAQVHIKGGEGPGCCKSSCELQPCDPRTHLIRAQSPVCAGCWALRGHTGFSLSHQTCSLATRADCYLKLCLDYAALCYLSLFSIFHQPFCLPFMFTLVKLNASFPLLFCNALNSVVVLCELFMSGNTGNNRSP